MLIQGPWPLRKCFQKCLKVIFLDVVFNYENNDTGSGSLSPILPDLNESHVHANAHSFRVLMCLHANARAC